MQKIAVLILCCTISLVAFADKVFNPVQAVYPPNWFAKMPSGDLQIVMYGSEISTFDISLFYPAVKIKKIIKPENPDYVIVYLEIAANARPGTMDFRFKKEDINATYGYQLLPREKSTQFSLQMQIKHKVNLNIDRFRNGDKGNDAMAAYNEKVADPNSPNARHGGDFKGFIAYIDSMSPHLNEYAYYLAPIMECNNNSNTYTGIPTTNFYRVESRYGNIYDLQEAIRKLHSQNSKLFLDMQLDNIGEKSLLFTYKPAQNWYDGNSFNFKNKDVQTFFIQNAIWWAEMTDTDGFDIINSPNAKKYIGKCLTEYFTKNYGKKSITFN